MNRNTKEITNLLKGSVRGVETARYRLRKRLSLNHDINFVEFLDKLSHPSNDIPNHDDEMND
ncbi:MAG: hypothetical protein ABFS32_10880 [Bacteroidota bacterium]